VASPGAARGDDEPAVGRAHGAHPRRRRPRARDGARGQRGVRGERQGRRRAAEVRRRPSHGRRAGVGRPRPARARRLVLGGGRGWARVRRRAGPFLAPHELPAPVMPRVVV
jgi:hypothetical protein